MSDAGELQEIARALADLADPITMRYFGTSPRAIAKPDGTPVTAADREVEAVIRHALAGLRPDDAILGEEEGGCIDPARVTWVVDPIDATKNFLRGIPVFATLIGAVHGDHILVGVVSAPAMGERWEASAGGGARRNGERIDVSAITDLADAHLLHGGIDHHLAIEGGWERLGGLARRAWRMRGFGDFWGHLLVASGRAEACFEPQLSPWDIVAPACIVTEAGGRVTSWEGGTVLHGGSVLSSNGLVHEDVRHALTA